MYTIVNAASNRPISAIGFCSSFSDKAKAEDAANLWNLCKSSHICRVKVVEYDQISRRAH